MVAPGVYRSGYPNERNFPFLRRLNIRTVVCLCDEPYLARNAEWAAAEGVELFECGVGANLEPSVRMDTALVQRALSVVRDRSKHPVLVHCEKGNHRTGVLVGCLRRAMRWSLTAISAEYRRFTGTNDRVLDLQFIELFEP